jgi:hypothetical protein
MAYIGQNIQPVEINNVAGEVINPATDESIALLRRMVKLIESQSSTDIANRQRITLDAIAAGLTLAAVTTVTGVTTVTTVTTVGTVNTVSNMTALAGYNQGQFIDVARNTYSNAIRNKLTFS